MMATADTRNHRLMLSVGAVPVDPVRLTSSLEAVRFLNATARDASPQFEALTGVPLNDPLHLHESTLLAHTIVVLSWVSKPDPDDEDSVEPILKGVALWLTLADAIAVWTFLEVFTNPEKGWVPK